MWPDQFERGTWDDGTPEAARATADRIDFFIATNGSDKTGLDAELIVKAETELWQAMGLMNDLERAVDDVIRYPEVTFHTDAPRETVLQEA